MPNQQVAAPVGIQSVRWFTVKIYRWMLLVTSRNQAR
jgi:hypothetical protein